MATEGEGQPPNAPPPLPPGVSWPTPPSGMKSFKILLFPVPTPEDKRAPRQTMSLPDLSSSQFRWLVETVNVENQRRKWTRANRPDESGHF